MHTEQKPQSQTAATSRPDDFGYEVAGAQGQVVTDDFGIQVTDNPIWVEQRLDPNRTLIIPSQPNS